MDYGQLLRDSWQVVWKNKFLLILGFLAALGGGSSAGSSNSNIGFSGEEIPPDFAERADVFLALFAPLLVGLICLGVFVAIVFWLIRLTAQAGLISAAARLEDGEKVSLGEALGAGLGKLGRMIGLYILLYGPFILLVVVLVGVSLLLAGAAIGYELSNASEALEPVLASLAIVVACIALLFCVLLPLIFLVSVFLPFAQRAAVLEDLGVTASIGRAWRVITGNLAEALILVLLFGAITIGYGIAVAIVMLPLAFLTIGPTMIGLIIDGTFSGVNFFALLCGGIGVGLLAAFLNALLTTYRSTAMTLAYRRLIEKAPE
jgi:hypothetical protein